MVATGRVALPVTFTLTTGNSGDPIWPGAVNLIEKFNGAGGKITAQVFARPIGLVIGLAIAAILFTGWQRVTLMSILTVATVLTLSRAAMLSFLVGTALVFVFHNMRARDRQAIVGTLTVLVGRWHGGPAQVSVLSSTLFGGVSGSAVADASAIGSLLIPWQKKLGYPPAFSAAVETVTVADLPSTWHEGCPVGPDALRRLTLTYWGFDDAAHTGTIVVNADVAEPVAELAGVPLHVLRREPGRVGQPVGKGAHGLAHLGAHHFIGSGAGGGQIYQRPGL